MLKTPLGRAITALFVLTLVLPWLYSLATDGDSLFGVQPTPTATVQPTFTATEPTLSLDTTRINPTPTFTPGIVSTETPTPVPTPNEWREYIATYLP